MRLANNLGEYTSRSPIHVWPRECFSNAGQQLGRLVWVADESEVSKGEREGQLEANCTDRSHCTGTDSGSSTSAVPALALSKPTLTSNTSSQHSHCYSRSGFDSGRRVLICSVRNDHDDQHVDASYDEKVCERRRWLRWGGASAEMAVVATSKATDREDEEGRHGKVCIEHQDQIKKTSYKEN